MTILNEIKVLFIVHFFPLVNTNLVLKLQIMGQSFDIKCEFQSRNGIIWINNHLDYKSNQEKVTSL